MITSLTSNISACFCQEVMNEVVLLSESFLHLIIWSWKYMANS